jgi:hypothetical protein
MRGERGALVVTASVAMWVTLAGCGGSDDRSITGPVTVAGPNLCVGADQAKGVCLDPGQVDLTAVHVGDCVRVTYRVPKPAKPTSDGEATHLAESPGNCKELSGQ